MTRASRTPAALLALTLVFAGSGRLHAQRSLTETRLEAAIVAKLVPFIDWPPGALEGRRSVDVCVTGSTSFTSDLEELESGETMKNLPVAVRRVDRERDVDGCHVLVLPSRPNSGASWRLLLRKASSLPILTISDDDRFLDDGGIVRLQIVDGHPRFDINDAVARRVGLRISSRLLGLAATVRRGSV